jgi:hypothetical protein
MIPRRLLGLFLFLLLTGCGGKVHIKGRIVRAGNPIAPGKHGYVQVTLVPVVEEGEHHTTIPTRATSDGSFEFRNISPGTYKIAVEHFDPTPLVDKLKSTHSPRNTKIVRHLDGKRSVTIDLEKPKG